MSTTKEPNRDQAIRSAGITQAVIASGAPIEQWSARIRYALLLQGAYALKLAGNKNVPMPVVPDFKDE